MMMSSHLHFCKQGIQLIPFVGLSNISFFFTVRFTVYKALRLLVVEGYVKGEFIGLGGEDTESDP